jgi:hypothetical protein
MNLADEIELLRLRQENAELKLRFKKQQTQINLGIDEYKNMTNKVMAQLEQENAELKELAEQRRMDNNELRSQVHKLLVYIEKDIQAGSE